MLAPLSSVKLLQVHLSPFKFIRVLSSSTESFQVHLSPFKFIWVLSSSSETFQVHQSPFKFNLSIYYNYFINNYNNYNCDHYDHYLYHYHYRYRYRYHYHYHYYRNVSAWHVDEAIIKTLNSLHIFCNISSRRDGWVTQHFDSFATMCLAMS